MRLEVNDVVVDFGRRRILAGASFVVESSTSVALMGPSGAGKSTLMAVIAGELVPQSGSVTVEASSSRDRHEWVLQSAPSLLHRSALDNVALGPLSRGYTRFESEVRAREVMSRLGIASLELTRLHQLSGGERQRVAVCRAVASTSGLLLADEPTASLDAASKELVINALDGAKRFGAAVIVATHDPDVARACDRTLYVQGGKLVEVHRA